MYHVGKLFTTKMSVNTPSPKALDVKSSHNSKTPILFRKSTDNSKISSFKVHVFIVGKTIHKLLRTLEFDEKISALSAVLKRKKSVGLG